MTDQAHLVELQSELQQIMKRLQVLQDSPDPSATGEMHKLLTRVSEVEADLLIRNVVMPPI